MSQNYRKRGLEKRYDVCEKTVDRRRKKGLIPPPDFYVGPIPYWTEKTLDQADKEAARDWLTERKNV
jgi:hypothetical protein